MTRNSSKRAGRGDRIGEDLSFLGVIDDRGREPVYIAWHHRAWCPMACKVFRSLERAKREAEVLATFMHPNIVRFLGLERPAHLLAEFLDGPTLGRLMSARPGGRLGVSDALRIAIHIGAALEHAHAKGFLHLDVKPCNIIVTKAGRPMLFDFGSARRIDAARPPYIAGTDPYIAPEECLLGKTGPAADTFSLAVTLYEMLTGEMPFSKGTKRQPFPQLTCAPIPARQHRSAVPRPLDDLLLACLSRRPEDRPSLSAFMMQLHPLITAGPRMWPAGFRPETAAEPWLEAA